MKKVVDQTVLCKDAAGTLVFEDYQLKRLMCLNSTLYDSFMTERDAGVLRKIRGKERRMLFEKTDSVFLFRLLFWRDRRGQP